MEGFGRVASPFSKKKQLEMQVYEMCQSNAGQCFPNETKSVSIYQLSGAGHTKESA